MQENKTGRGRALPVYFALFLFGAIALLFIFTFISVTEGSGGVADEDLTSETYMDVVSALLEIGNPENAPDLLNQRICNSCHLGGNIAPLFSELDEVAVDRRPPLTMSAYIYESVMYPQSFIVEGRQGNMPHLFTPPVLVDGELVPADGDSLDDLQALADILSYLVSGEAE